MELRARASEDRVDDELYDALGFTSGIACGRRQGSECIAKGNVGVWDNEQRVDGRQISIYNV